MNDLWPLPGDLGCSVLPSWIPEIMPALEEKFEAATTDTIAPRQIVNLAPSNQFWALAEPDRCSKGAVIRLTLLGRRGNYLWQLVGQIPPMSLWLIESHTDLRSQLAQIRKCAGIAYKPAGLTKPQIKNDQRVLRAIAQHGIKLHSQLMRNAGVTDRRALEASLKRLQNQGLVKLNAAGLAGFRLPCKAEVETWTFRNPYQPRRKTRVIQKDEDLMVEVERLIRIRSAKNGSGVSQRELRKFVSCGPGRLQETVRELEIRDRIKVDRRRKKSIFPIG